MSQVRDTSHHAFGMSYTGRQVHVNNMLALLHIQGVSTLSFHPTTVQPTVDQYLPLQHCADTDCPPQVHCYAVQNMCQYHTIVCFMPRIHQYHSLYLI